MKKVLILMVVVFSGCAAASDPCKANPSACDGGLDASGPDGGDPGSDGGSEAGPAPQTLDWRNTRGPALAAEVIGEYPGEAFALSETSFAVRSGCDGGLCSTTVRGFDGGVVAALGPTRTMYGLNISPDGKQALLAGVTAEGTCTDAEGYTSDWFQGAQSLVDLASGEVRLSLPGLRNLAFAEPAFFRGGSHIRTFIQDPATCASDTLGWRSTQPPHAQPAGLPPRSYVDDDLPDGRLLVSTFPETVSVRAADGTRGVEVSTGAVAWFASGEFVHAFERWPVTSVASLELAADAVRRGAPAVGGLYPEGASHRFLSLCGSDDLQHRRPCEVLDGKGVLPPADVLVDQFARRRQLAVAGREEFLVYLDGMTGGVVRRDLRTGADTPLPLPPGLLRPVGDGGAVLLLAGQGAWAIERDRVFAFEGRLAGAYALDVIGGDPALPQSQVVLVVTTSPSGGEAWLTAWHVGLRRVVRLTDSLNYNPPFGAPFTASEDCAMPGYVRSAGTPAESAGQRARYLHFTRFVPAELPKLEVYVLPVDLSAPPRLFAELDRGLCTPPLASPGGGRLWLPVRTPAGVVRAVFATW